MGIGGGGVSTGGGQGGASNFDVGLFNQAVGQNVQELHNRYQQLGLGIPSTSGPGGGDPDRAAAAGQSLTYGGPSTMEQQDVANQQNVLQALIGQQQAANASNPFAPGSPANLGAAANQSAASSFGALNAGVGALGALK